MFLAEFFQLGQEFLFYFKGLLEGAHKRLDRCQARTRLLAIRFTGQTDRYKASAASTRCVIDHDHSSWSHDPPSLGASLVGVVCVLPPIA